MYLQLVFLIGLCVKNAIIPKKKMGSNTFKLVMICQYYIKEERQLCFAFFSL